MKKKTYEVTKQSLISTPIPEQTRTYKPIAHELLMDLTLNSLQTSGFKLDREEYSASSDGQVANGRFTVSNVADKEMQLEIGWQNSYNKSLTLKFAIGTRIFICQNGAVSGDFGAFRKKHMGSVQEFTPAAITEYIKQAGDVFKKMQMDRDKMKTIEVTKRTAAELIGRMMIEEQFIQSTQVNLIEKELKMPTYDYGAPGSMWELYNFTTQSMREVHPRLWMENHMKAHTFFVNESGIITRKDAQIIIPEPGALEQLSMEFPDAVEIVQ